MPPTSRSSPSQNDPGSLFRRYRLGNFEVVSLLDGILHVPHREGYIRNASVEEAKAALRDAGLSDSYVPIPFTVTAVKMAGRLLLIDVGTGGFSIYGTRCGWLAESMAAAGLDPKTVDTVLVTHLHGDHIYGLMHEESNEQVFPQAEIIVPADELAWWTRPEVAGIDFGPTRAGLAERIRSNVACWKNVRTVKENSEVLPGIWAIPTPGHSPGHTAYLFKCADTQLLATADVSLLPELFLRNPHWQINLDQNPVQAVETRKRIFEWASDNRILVTGTHWLMPNVGHVVRSGSGFVLQPAPPSVSW